MIKQGFAIDRPRWCRRTAPTDMRMFVFASTEPMHEPRSGSRMGSYTPRHRILCWLRHPPDIRTSPCYTRTRRAHVPRTCASYIRDTPSWSVRKPCDYCTLPFLDARAILLLRICPAPPKPPTAHAHQSTCGVHLPCCVTQC